jgi:mono/diheme cytochrome c family protein
MSKMSFQRYLKISLPVILLALFSLTSSAQDGEALFKSQCSACHSVKDKMIGPALMGMEKRNSEEWLIKWIKNSQAMVKAGDPYAVKIFNEFNKVPMTSFNLKDDEIKSIIAYVKAEAEKQEPVATTGPVSSAPVEKEKPVALYLLIALLVLAFLAAILAKVQKTLATTVRQQEGLPEPPELSRWQSMVAWARSNKKLVAVILIFFTLYGTVKAWYAMQAIGISQGYTPAQPIAYSHKLHAGDLQIQCVYCHSGAERGKVAGIPSANVCMNCHKYVRKGPETGTEEIAKIYKALDYDLSTGVYGPNQKPIEWVRVHNLPDLAYFNHAQHVSVGKIDCQTCHGAVQETMTVASQHAPLTMVWCLDCHKSTEVKMEGNGYYEEYHKKMLSKYGSEAKLTVDKIGGLECSRCHY